MWLTIEPSYVTQMCMDTRLKHRNNNVTAIYILKFVEYFNLSQTWFLNSNPDIYLSNAKCHMDFMCIFAGFDTFLSYVLLAVYISMSTNF